MENAHAIAPEMTLGQRLRAARSRTGLNLRQVADAVPGMSHAAIANWERDEADPSSSKLVKLAKFYGVDIRWLVEGIDTEGVSAYPGRTRPGVHTGQTLLFELAAA
jgi:transcriptional regulator with XRE-family HTH domain